MVTGILWVQFATSTAEAWLTGLIPSILISPKKVKSPTLTSLLDVCSDDPVSVQGWSLLENARVSPIKTPGDFGSASPEVPEFKPAGSADVTVPSYFTSRSVVVSFKFLYFLSIKYFVYKRVFWQKNGGIFFPPFLYLKVDFGIPIESVVCNM